jgi:UDP-glucose 4-epimerase
VSYPRFFSSLLTFIFQPDSLPVKETAPLKRPTNPYGRTKFFIEEIFRDMYVADQRWNIVLLRYEDSLACIG